VDHLCDHACCSRPLSAVLDDLECRYLTDVVFGNRLGMMTIRPAPLTTKGEPLGVVMVGLTSGAERGRPAPARMKAASRAAPQLIQTSNPSHKPPPVLALPWPAHLHRRAT
jgi:hypothetical protein